MGKASLSRTKDRGRKMVPRVHHRTLGIARGKHGLDRVYERLLKKIKLDYSLTKVELSKSQYLVKRPGFSSNKKKASIIEASLATKLPMSSLKPGKLDLAQPHRLPYTELRRIVFDSPNPTKRRKDIETLLNASKEYEELFQKESERIDQGTSKDRKAKFSELQDRYETTREDVEVALTQFERKKSFNNACKLLRSLNNLASNAPGLGPHREVNLPTLDRLHVMPYSEDEPEVLTPRSKAAVEVSASTQTIATAKSKNQESILAPSGAFFPLRKKRQNSLKRATKVVLNAPGRIKKFIGSLKPRFRSSSHHTSTKEPSYFIE